MLKVFIFKDGVKNYVGISSAFVMQFIIKRCFFTNTEPLHTIEMRTFHMKV